MERANKEKREIENWGQYQLGRRFELNWSLWQYNDIIGFFEVLANRHGLLFVHEYLSDNKILRGDPTERRKRNVTMSRALTESPSYPRLAESFNGRGPLKQRVLRVLDELTIYVECRNMFIDTTYYKNLVKSMDIDRFIRLPQPSQE